MVNSFGLPGLLDLFGSFGLCFFCVLVSSVALVSLDCLVTLVCLATLACLIHWV